MSRPVVKLGSLEKTVRGRNLIARFANSGSKFYDSKSSRNPSGEPFSLDKKRSAKEGYEGFFYA
jgi:hypothetical protein